MNMITHRVSPQQARYTPMGGREKCWFCRFYIAPKWCGHVTGPVSPMGWCKYFSQEMRQRFGGSTVAGGGPSLALDFMNPGNMPGGLTFTRASTATYTDNTATLRTAAVNAPRWDYAGGSLRGLLIEEARTNLVTQSTNFGSVWVIFVATQTPAYGIAPDGTLSMTRLAEAVGTSQHYAKLNLTLAASTQYTYSIYAKAAEVRYLSFEVDDGVANGAYVTFDLQTGGISQALTAIGAAVVGAATIVPVGGGVYHCSATTSLATGTAASILWQTSNVPAPGQYATYAGNPANGLSIWGAQIELGAFATSYIPTTGTTVTRAVDLASMPFTPTASGTWQAKFIPSGIASGLPYIISGNAGSPAMAIGADSRLVASIRGGASVFSGITPAMTFNAVNKAAFGWLTGGSKAAVNGTLLGANAVALAVTGTSVQLGSDGVTPGNNALNGGLQSIQYWPRQLSDVEMQQVTT